MELQTMQDRSATTDDGVSGGASLPVAVGQSETRLGLPFQRPSNRRQETTPWWRLFVQIRWGSILAVVPTLLLVVLVIQNIVFFHLNRPQDIVKELGALVATLPNSIPDHNCSDLACHWAALQTALAKLKAGQEAGQTALAELKASHTAISSDLEKSQSLQAKVWEEIRSNKDLLNLTLKDLETDYKNMSQELSQETKELHNFSLALSSLQQKVVDQPTLNRELHGLMPRDCSDVMAAGMSQSGVYTFFIGSNSFEAYCNMNLDKGGWTVIQRRKDGSVNFFRGWDDYRKGFGDLAGEHWLGLQNIHALTASGAYQLRIDFTIFDGRNYYALYNDFSLGRNSLDPEKDGYPLLVSGHSGNAGDSLTSHSGMKFSTKDRDQDKNSGNCANTYKGAWWYKTCYRANLNGMYKATGTCGNTNAVWYDLGQSSYTCLRFVEMKIRPRK
ncbi:fibrinogen C domain-containing protein 1-like [Syngnathus scovelli]|uniref:fibrinogen C domain-containing protein 1-like n=1 Tax=Syngnathus scovelli TaxID=161590 RepID=UPI00211036E7|nr:fibrinogen C domain-containing protein 1-like [Syngnathus scovelli]